MIKNHIINRKAEYSKYPQELREKIDRFVALLLYLQHLQQILRL